MVIVVIVTFRYDIRLAISSALVFRCVNNPVSTIMSGKATIRPPTAPLAKERRYCRMVLETKSGPLWLCYINFEGDISDDGENSDSREKKFKQGPVM